MTGAEITGEATYEGKTGERFRRPWIADTLIGLLLVWLELNEWIAMAATIVAVPIVMRGLWIAHQNDRLAKGNPTLRKPTGGWLAPGVVIACCAVWLWNRGGWQPNSGFATDGVALVGCIAGIGCLVGFIRDVVVGSFPFHGPRYAAAGVVLVLSFMAIGANAPQKLHFVVAKREISRTVKQVRTFCASKAAPSPSFNGSTVSAFACTADGIEFVAGTWSGYFDGGTWGFSNSKVAPSKIERGPAGPVEKRTVRQLADGWWLWQQQDWID